PSCHLLGSSLRLVRPGSSCLHGSSLRHLPHGLSSSVLLLKIHPPPEPRPKIPSLPPSVGVYGAGTRLSGR
ncbi:hypothetical protein M9458_002872, partial [Cirrhinus mrigala]